MKIAFELNDWLWNESRTEVRIVLFFDSSKWIRNKN
jgi:hypothetical protein